MPKNILTKIKKIKKNRKRKQQFRFKDKLLKRWLFLASVLLVILAGIEIVQFFVPITNLIRKNIDSYPRPVYIVDSQNIDIDTYLRQYFSNKKPKKTMMVTATAYSSATDQTDGTPYMTAYNTFVRDGIVAANFLPIGTVVRFPKKFDDKFFVVEDKMDERFGLQVDIWMSNQDEAKKFGIQYLEMEIF